MTNQPPPPTGEPDKQMSEARKAELRKQGPLPGDPDYGRRLTMEETKAKAQAQRPDGLQQFENATDKISVVFYFIGLGLIALMLLVGVINFAQAGDGGAFGSGLIIAAIAWVVVFVASWIGFNPFAIIIGEVASANLAAALVFMVVGLAANDDTINTLGALL